MDERFKLAGFTALGMLVLASVMTGLSASLLEIASDFGIPPSRAGILYTLHFGGFLGLIVLSLLLRGLRARLRLVTLAAALYTIALAAAGGSGSFLLLAVALFVAGGSGGLIESHTATLQVMTSRNESEAGRLVALTQVFFAVGALLTPVYLAMEEQLGAEWRRLFFFLAAVALVALLFGLRMRADRFAHVHGEGGAFLWRPLFRVSVAMALYVGAEVTIFGWAPTVMELYHGIPLGRARLAPTLFWLGMLAGRIVTARITGRFSPTTLLRFTSLLGVISAVMLATVSGEWLLWLALVLAAAACAGIWPLIVATSGVSGHETGTTIVVAAGGLGAAIFPYLAGITSELLPGRYILAMAAPLLLGVFFLSRRSEAPA
ncbi:MAG: MFS transporter [Spirochaetaceae bacterium]